MTNELRKTPGVPENMLLGIENSLDRTKAALAGQVCLCLVSDIPFGLDKALGGF